MITLSLDYIRLDRTHALAQIEGHHGPYAVLMVTDTGAGIPPEILDRVFDPFFTTKGEGQGTGLGLSTVRGIVKGHGGFLTVDSKVGRGTTFRIYLPAVLSPPSALLPSSASTAGRSTGILLVDDEPMILSALELVLADEGYRVFTALSAKEALGIFETNRPELHLIVTDIRLKDANEMEFIRALRARDPRCPIIAISGVVKSSQFEKDLLAIGVPFLAKPIKGEVLLSAVKSALKARPPA
jgi:CheY-like chemotaxis protein